MSAETQVSRDELLATVARVRPQVERASLESETLRTLPPSSVDALTASGLLRIKLPAALGGHEADLLTQYEVLEAMAYADAAAGWCLMIGASAIALLGAYLPDAGLSDVFPSGRVPRAAVVVAPVGAANRQDGGYHLSGRWSFASGVHHADWLCVGAYVPEGPGGEPFHRLFALPIDQARVHDNWDTLGLRGTGSSDVSVEGVWVPLEHTFEPFSGQPERGGPLYRLGMPAFVAYEHAAFAIGVARRALDTIVELAPSRKRGQPPAPLVERETFQRDLGELDLRLRAARALVLDLNRDAWQSVLAGGKPDSRLQTELRSAVTFATDVAIDVVTQAYRYAGGTTVYRPNFLERALRDLNTASQHFMVSNAAYEQHGRAMLGLQ
jgi:alkylation response protein AidB-like acyl-CoA dehydrogenase